MPTQLTDADARSDIELLNLETFAGHIYSHALLASVTLTYLLSQFASITTIYLLLAFA